MYIRDMNNLNFYGLMSTLVLSIWTLSCTPKDTNLKEANGKTLPAKPTEINLEGSILMVDGGIMVLTQNGPLQTAPVILLPAHDSLSQQVNVYYQQMYNEHYESSPKTWVKIAGNFIKDDSIRSIFKFTWVQFLDENGEMQIRQEMEE
jgi:hypothetical protein